MILFIFLKTFPLRRILPNFAYMLENEINKNGLDGLFRNTCIIIVYIYQRVVFIYISGIPKYLGTDV
jgi:hypothetical protein